MTLRKFEEAINVFKKNRYNIYLETGLFYLQMGDKSQKKKMELTGLAVVERLTDVESQKKCHAIFRDELSTESGSDFLIDWNAIIILTLFDLFVYSFVICYSRFI